MNLGQIMLVIAAMALLGLFALSGNTSLVQSNDVANASEAAVTATTLASSLIEEAQSKSFDQAVVDHGPVSTVSALTAVSDLGPDGGETYSSGFNDIDDYNNLYLVYTGSPDTNPEPGADSTIIVPGMRARFFVRAKVEYVDGDFFDPAGSQTWYKRMTVTVSSPTWKDSVAIPTVMSYWK